MNDVRSGCVLTRFRNVRSKTLLLLILTLCLLLPASAAFGKSKWITKVGESADSIDDAIQQALRAAVEQAAGVYVHGRSETLDYELAYDEIISTATGYVEEYKVVSKKKVGDIYQAKVRAKVSTDKIESDFGATRLMIERKGRPRLMVVISEEIDGTEGNSRAAATALEGFFIKKGFDLIDHSQVDSNKERNIKLANLAGDLNKIAAFGAEYGAEVMIVGKSTAVSGGRQEIYDMDFFSSRADVEIRAVRVDTAKALAAEIGSSTRQAKNKWGASKDALGFASSSAAEKMVKGLLKAWIFEIQSGADTYFLISGVGFGDLQKLQDYIEGLDQVNSVTRLSYRNKIVKLRISSKLRPDDLAGKVQAYKRIRLEITGADRNSFEMEVSSE